MENVLNDQCDQLRCSLSTAIGAVVHANRSKTAHLSAFVSAKVAAEVSPPEKEVIDQATGMGRPKDVFKWWSQLLNFIKRR